MLLLQTIHHTRTHTNMVRVVVDQTVTQEVFSNILLLSAGLGQLGTASRAWPARRGQLGMASWEREFK
jgi:hypothetical protein